MWSEKEEQQVEGKQSPGQNGFNTIQIFDKQITVSRKTTKFNSLPIPLLASPT